ncbi:MAG: hypothetical protein GWP10_13300 [Nitrospiraceae bacterium]|nr:hypothetical protein [Nitrospiraceae bacterium]
MYIDLLKIFFAVDTGIIVFCYLEDNIKWFLNTQIAFFSSLLIIFGAFIGYFNMVKTNLKNENKYFDDKESKKLKWYNYSLFSFTRGFNFVKLSGYICLIAGFFWLNSKHYFDVLSFLFGVSLVPAIAFIYYFLKK